MSVSHEESELSTSLTTVSVVGRHTHGDADPVLHHAARRIAAIAHAQLLSVSFSGPGPDANFVGADIFPSLADDSIADAVMGLLGATPAAHA